MFSDVAAPRLAPFSVTRVFAESFRALRSNFLLFVIPAFVFRLIWLFVPLFDRFGFIIGEKTWTDEVAKPVLGMISAGLTEAAVAFGILLTLQGRSASWVDASRGLKFFVPVSIAGVIFCVPGTAASLAVGLARLMSGDSTSVAIHIAVVLMILLLAVAVAIIATAWFVFAPAIVFEQTSAVEGLVRSAELTEGRRWRIIGICVLLMLILVVMLVPIAVFTDMRLAELLSPTRLSISAALAYLVQAIFHAFSAIVIVVVYCFLRTEHDRLTGNATPPISALRRAR